MSDETKDLEELSALYKFVSDQARRNQTMAERLVAFRDAANGLLNALPKCEDCDRPATRSYGDGMTDYCDEPGHGTELEAEEPHWPKGEVPELAYAVELRKVVEVLKIPASQNGDSFDRLAKLAVAHLEEGIWEENTSKAFNQTMQSLADMLKLHGYEIKEKP